MKGVIPAKRAKGSEFDRRSEGVTPAKTAKGSGFDRTSEGEIPAKRAKGSGFDRTSEGVIPAKTANGSGFDRMSEGVIPATEGQWKRLFMTRMSNGIFKAMKAKGSDTDPDVRGIERWPMMAKGSTF